ncbi:electron transport complex subunit RsxG [Pseudoalteromonas sp. MMG013]|uniref:Ion-translocating oxidoreductase complex subunit G n=1 Tax=Pseudoalteromonas aurantia 208 TaxID=1314867 RepID=A0ABR9EEW8_9GAMM|nr:MULTISPECIES: electron transport complex subunit RsxG [Pseudoalteromonas]MBE0368944.1 electron transport complex protein RnfG [Pseudoalteromonas aurantia 208]MBQ4848109.1 electron transport complex subunit RsxG [Pseudoalteromonas sp. MMG005]MBQ4863258.1 electron transport complex subunit RsxG [Pseudoalteromonas sp. MMG013]
MIVQSMYKNGAILTAFALITTGSVALVQTLTAERINEQEQQHLMGLLGQVLPHNEYDNVLYKDCVLSNAPELGPNGPYTLYRAYKNDAPSAVLVRHTTPHGYSGNIDVLSAIHADGRISGVRVTRHEETPGLGDKVELAKSDWITTFNGMVIESQTDPRFAVKKDAGQFDQFTGATITPRAVVSSVKQAAWYAKQNFEALFNAENACGDTQ